MEDSDSVEDLIAEIDFMAIAESVKKSKKKDEVILGVLWSDEEIDESGDQDENDIVTTLENNIDKSNLSDYLVEEKENLSPYLSTLNMNHVTIRKKSTKKWCRGSWYASNRNNKHCIERTLSFSGTEQSNDVHAQCSNVEQKDLLDDIINQYNMKHDESYRDQAYPICITPKESPHKSLGIHTEQLPHVEQKDCLDDIMNIHNKQFSNVEQKDPLGDIIDQYSMKNNKSYTQQDTEYPITQNENTHKSSAEPVNIHNKQLSNVEQKDPLDDIIDQYSMKNNKSYTDQDTEYPITQNESTHKSFEFVNIHTEQFSNVEQKDSLDDIDQYSIKHDESYRNQEYTICIALKESPRKSLGMHTQSYMEQKDLSLNIIRDKYNTEHNEGDIDQDKDYCSTTNENLHKSSETLNSCLIAKTGDFSTSGSSEKHYETETAHTEKELNGVERKPEVILATTGSQVIETGRKCNLISANISSSSDDDFEAFLIEMKTPKPEKSTKCLPSMESFVVDDWVDVSSDEDEPPPLLNRILSDLKTSSKEKLTSIFTPSRKGYPVSVASSSDEENCPSLTNDNILMRNNDKIFSTKKINAPKRELKTPLRKTPLEKRVELKSSSSTNSIKKIVTPYINTPKKLWPKIREELSKELFRCYNETVFENKLPRDMPITWNKQMRKTAGFCYYIGPLMSRRCRIELSEKVVDSCDRIRDTLIHELCHAATWLIDGIKAGHGPHWKRWAAKARCIHSGLPPISRCHSYEINYKFNYRCVKCNHRFGRHSKSVNLKTSRCPYCLSALELLPKLNKDGLPAKTRAPSKFSLFVKENYGKIKSDRSGSHQEIMKELSRRFAETLTTKENT